MTTPANRFKGWIESLADSWKDRLRGWMASWVETGIVRLIEFLEPEGIDITSDVLAQIKEDPNTPDTIKIMIDKLTAGTQPIPLLILIPLAVLMLTPQITAIFQPLGNLFRYGQERVVRSSRLDPLSVITAWRRDAKTYEPLFNDLRDQGWSEDRIEALKFVTLFYPAPADLVRWQAREVFEPNMVTKYGLDDELGEIEREPFYRAGMTDEQITNYWRAHWEHASYMQMVEMLHRGLITEQEFYEWFRLVEIVPYWRNNLIQTAYAWPTRVDVRRFFDLKTIDEARLREIYSGMGYRGKNLDDYVLWTKIYVALPDLIARWKNGWLTLEQVRTELVGYGMNAEAADELIQTKVKAEEPEEIVEAKNLTKTEIYKGVNAEILNVDQAIELLMDLDYTLPVAEYLLLINTEALTGSPKSFDEFKAITDKYRIASGLEVKTMPEDIKEAAQKVVNLTKDVEALDLAIKEEQAKLIPDEELPEAATARLKELQVARNRAIAELELAQNIYNAKVAEWRQKG